MLPIRSLLQNCNAFVSLPCIALFIMKRSQLVALWKRGFVVSTWMGVGIVMAVSSDGD